MFLIVIFERQVKPYLYWVDAAIIHVLCITVCCRILQGNLTEIERVSDNLRFSLETGYIQQILNSEYRSLKTFRSLVKLFLH